MSVARQSASQSLMLPDAFGSGLRAWAWRGAGLAILGGSGFVFALLLAWAERDNGAGGPFGKLGQDFADLIFQSLGLGAPILLFAPVSWGLDTLTATPIERLRFRVIAWPVAALALMTALAAVPTPGAWPLHNGFGGILGDVLFEIARLPAMALPPLAAALMTGLALGGAGTWLMGRVLGIDVGRLALMLRRAPRPAAAAIEHRLDRPSPFMDPDADEAEADTGAGEASLMSTERPIAGGPPLAQRLADLDDPEALASQAMARRFAPPGATPIKSVSGIGWLRRPEPAGVPVTEPGPPIEMHASFAEPPPASRYKLPSLRLLMRSALAKPGADVTQQAMRGNARLLEDVLDDFGIKGKIVNARPGPVITVYELEPARGVKASRVVALGDDIARSMSAASARVAIVPGRNAIGIELPNARREPVSLRQLFEQECYRLTGMTLPLVLGKATDGTTVIADLARMPHLLIAGTTGSGKSVGINAMILSLLYKLTPDQCRLILIDPKMLELSVYNGIPHLLTPVVTDPRKAIAALNWAVHEMEERYKRMSLLNVRNIDTFNNALRNAARQGNVLSRTVQTGFNSMTGEAVYERQTVAPEPMPYIVIVIDEMADLMLTAGKEIEAAVQRLAQMARAAGIHLITATQRPSVDVITGTIKANLPTRLSFKVASKIDSRTILGEQGAEQLLGAGDMLYASSGGQLVRVHGPFVSDEEVEAVATDLCRQGAPNYVTAVTESTLDSSVAPATDEDDDLYEDAVALAFGDGKISISYLQRRLQIGYNRAATLVERMESAGLVGPAGRSGKREILRETREAKGRGASIGS